jgi:MFS family permease
MVTRSRGRQLTTISPSYGLVLSILFASGLNYTLLGALLLPAVTSLSHSLHSSEIDTTWVLTAYVLSGGVATPIAGRLGDMYGKKRTLVWLLVVVAIGTLVCALSSSLAPMVVGRLISGVASGVFPLAYGIVRDEFPRDRVATAIGVISVSVGVGTGVAVVLAGFLVEDLPYHWLFWFPLATIIPTLVATWLWIPESPLRPGGRMDWVGASVMALGLLGVLLGISKASAWGWGSERTLALLVSGIGILAVWVAVELRTRTPLIDMHTMAIKAVWRTNLTASLFGFGMFAAFAIVPEFVEQPISTGYGYGASVIGAGLFLLPAAVTMALVGLLAGRIERRTGSKAALLLGGLFGTVGFVLVAISHGVPWHIYTAMGIVGIGLGLGFAALPNLIVTAVPPEQTGAATGINTIMRVLGGAVGIQVCATIVAQQVAAPGGLPLQSGFTASFWVCALGLAGACAVAATVPGRSRMAAAKAVLIDD